MLERHSYTPSWTNRIRHTSRNVGGVVVRWGWERMQRYGAIGPMSRKASGFGAFGLGSVICFPYDTIVNEHAFTIGADTLVNTGAVLSCGWGPGQPGLPPDMLRIGDRCLIGRGSSIVAHLSIILEDDVWTGQQVHITDLNHGYVDLDRPIAQQADPALPVRIGAGSWLGHHVVVLPGVTIGKHVVVGAGSIVTRDLPDFSVAVGSPARVIRRFDETDGWIDVEPDGRPGPKVKDGVAGLANHLRELGLMGSGGAPSEPSQLKGLAHGLGEDVLAQLGEDVLGDMGELDGVSG